MDVPALGEAVDLTFVGVDDVGELVPAGEADGFHDGPPPGTGGDVRDPVDVADCRGGEVVLGGARGEDDLGNPAALVDQRREDDLHGGDGVEEHEDVLAAEEDDGEREPAVAGADAAASRDDGGELEGPPRGEGGGVGAPAGVVGDHEERGRRRRERAAPRRAGAPRAGIPLEVEAVSDAAEEIRRQVSPAPERRHGDRRIRDARVWGGRMQAIPLLGNFTIHCSGGGFYEGALSVTMRLRNSPTGQGIGTAFPGTQTQPTALILAPNRPSLGTRYEQFLLVPNKVLEGFWIPETFQFWILLRNVSLMIVDYRSHSLKMFGRILGFLKGNEKEMN